MALDNNQILIIFDALAYILTFLYWCIKLRRFNVGLLLLLIMTISHVGCIFYYTVLKDLGLLEANLKVLPFVYLYLMIIICLYPYLIHGGIKIIDDIGLKSSLMCLSVFIILLNIEPFLENLLLLSSSNSDYSELYEDMREGELNIYSSVGKKLMSWAHLFRIITPVLFFYFVQKNSRNRLVLFGLGLCIINQFLYWINIGARGGILSQFFILTLCFLLFYRMLPSNIINYIKKYGLLSIIVGLIFFAGITVSRYESGNSNKTIVGWLLLYSSEGPIRFNTEMWDGQHNTKGDVNLNYFKNMLGMKTYITYEDRDEYYLAKNGRRIEVFYTYIGDFVSDFDYIGGFLICLCLFVITTFLFRYSVVPVENVFLLLLFSHLYSIGFASNMYRSYGMQKEMLIIVLLFFVCCSIRKWTIIKSLI